jgi:hypothetical protein
MIKSLLRRTATLGLIGSVVLTGWLGTTLKALGLPEEKFNEILGRVPVFVIVDEQGSPLSYQQKESGKIFTIAFVSEADAKRAYQQFEQEKPEESKNFKVMGIPLPVIHKFQVDITKEENHLGVQFIPTQDEVEAAQEVLKPSGQEYRGGVPLFVATFIPPGQTERVYLAGVDPNNSNQPIIPYFFDKDDLQANLDELKKNDPQFPKFAETVEIQVVLLEQMIDVLANQDSEQFTRFRLIPSKESQAYILQIQNQGNSQNQPNP